MKKLFAILAIAGALVACDNSTKDKAAEGADSTQTANPTTDAKATDSAAMATDKMEAGKDSVKEGDKMMDKAADKMEAGKDSVKEGGKMMDKAADKMKEGADKMKEEPKKN